MSSSSSRGLSWLKWLHRLHSFRLWGLHSFWLQRLHSFRLQGLQSFGLQQLHSFWLQRLHSFRLQRLHSFRLHWLHSFRLHWLQSFGLHRLRLNGFSIGCASICWLRQGIFQRHQLLLVFNCIRRAIMGSPCLQSRPQASPLETLHLACWWKHQMQLALPWQLADEQWQLAKQLTT